MYSDDRKKIIETGKNMEKKQKKETWIQGREKKNKTWKRKRNKKNRKNKTKDKEN